MRGVEPENDTARVPVGTPPLRGGEAHQGPPTFAQVHPVATRDIPTIASTKKSPRNLEDCVISTLLPGRGVRCYGTFAVM